MKLTERLRLAVDALSLRTPAPIVSSSATLTRTPIPRTREFARFVSLYENNPIAIACVGVRASTLSEAPLVVLNTTTGELDHEHPLSKLFRNPNPYQGQAAFWQQVSTYLDIGGNCYIYIEDSVLGNPIALYAYNDAQVAPVLDSMGWIAGYQYSLGGQKKTWNPRQIIHLKNPMYIDPLKPWSGISCVQVAQADIEIHNQIQESLYSIAANNFVPMGVLSTQQGISDKLKALLKEQLMKRYDARGRERAEPLVLADGMAYSQMGLSLQDMAFKDMIGQIETAICGVFRVHPSVAMTYPGLISSTYSNMETAHIEFTKLVRQPWWNSVEEQIESGLRSRFPGIQLEFDTSHVAALQADMESSISPTVSMFGANLITVNEARVKMGFEPLDGEDGDKYSFEVIPPAAPAFFNKDVEQQRDEDDIVEEVERSADGKVLRVRWHESEALRYWTRNNDIVTNAEKQLEPYVRGAFAQMEQQLLGGDRAVRKVGTINIEQILQQFMSASAGVRRTLFSEILGFAVQAAGSDLTSVQSWIDDIQRDAVRETTSKMKTALDTAAKDVSVVLETNAGASASKIAELLKEKFTTMTEARAQTIARTTARSTATKTMNATWEGMNARETNPSRKLYNVWLTQRDDKVREAHERMDGTFVEVGAEFTFPDGSVTVGPSAGGSANMAINCRCTMRPVRAAALGLTT